MGLTLRVKSTSAAYASSRRPTSMKRSTGRASSRRCSRCPSSYARFEANSEGLADVPLAASDIERVFRDEYGRAVAVLVRRFGDIDLAEEVVQDAFAIALQRWPSDGLPPSPAGWIITTARNQAINRLRREASREERHAQAAMLHS